MALSYYANWDTFQHEFVSDTSYYLAQEEETKLHLGLYNDDFGLPPDSCFDVDNFFEPDYCDLLFSPENRNSLPQPEYNNNLNNTTITPESYQALPQESVAFHALKRQKLIDDFEQLYSDQLINPGSTNYNELQDNYHLPDVIIPTLPDFSTRLPAYSSGSCEVLTKPARPISASSLSAQSIAARQRRRKISEKTHELGKLIPGGHKMNTAEMFGAAYKYIKYLQAQVGILEYMDSYHREKGDLFQSEDELHGLLESTSVQEKLYSEEKCLVPRKFVQELANDQEVFELKSHVLKEVNQLMINP